jgi:outer membrane protein, heavy metal efflux system
MPRHLAPLFLSGFILLSVCSQASGQASQPAPLTVDDAVRLAIRDNPRVIAAARDVDSAASGVRSARALTNPNAFFAPGVTSISGTGEEFLFQQPLEINGTRAARTGVAQAGLRATQAQVTVSMRDVVFATKSAYYELARAREQAAVAAEALEVAREFDRIARRQVEEGARPGIDLAQTGLEVARAQRQVTLADAQAVAALAALNTALGRDPATPVGALTPLSAQSESLAPIGGGEGATLPTVAPPVNPTAAPTNTPVQPPSATGAVDQSTAALLNQASTSRAEILAGQATGDQFRQEARLARAEGRPDLVPQFRVGYFTRGLQPTNDGNGAGIGVALTLPLFDYGNRRNRIRQAEQAALAQDARVVAIQNEVRQQVTQAIARLRAAEDIVRAYADGVLEQAQRLLDASRVGFREGRTSVVALLEAQRSFRAVQNEYVNALADVAIARAEVERATGAFPITPSLSARP